MKRRTYLKSAGVALGSSVLTGVGAASREFDRVVNVVEAGADNSGSDPIDGVLRDVLGDGTLVEFPDGEYAINQLSLWGKRNFGMRATGDATLVPGDDYNQNLWIGGSDFSDFLFEGFTIDNTEEGKAPAVKMLADDGLTVRDVTKRGVHDGAENAFQFRVTDSDGDGLVERLRAPDGGPWLDAPGGSPVGVYVDSDGPITFRDCQIERFGNNGLYAAHSSAPITVEGGHFENNDVAQIRLGSAGSAVRGAEIVVDDPEYESGNFRGIRISDGPGPVTVEDCDISVSGAQGTGAIVGAYSGGSFTVRDTRIRVGRDYEVVGSGDDTSRGIYVDEPTGIDDPGERVIENVSITGEAHDRSAMQFDRGNNRVENVCISQSGSHRKGIEFADGTDDNVVRNAAIDVAADSIGEGGIAAIRGLGAKASCPVPRIGSSAERFAASEGGEADEARGDDRSSSERLVVFDGTEARKLVRYEITVSGSVEHDHDHGTVGGVDSIDGRTASGAVRGGVDAYRYTGDIAEANVSGDVGSLVVTVDGERVDPESLGS